MCWEVCGPDMDATPEELEAYGEWLDSFDEFSEEEDETPTKIHEREALDRFDDFLNEVYPTISICGYDYDPAQALKMVDEVAYREEFNNWLDSEGLELE